MATKPRRTQAGARRQEEAKQREARWRRILQEQRRSGLNNTDFCRARSIPLHTYFWWKGEIRRRDERRQRQRSSRKRRATRAPTSTPALIPLRVSHEDTGRSTAFEVVLSRGRVLRVPAHFDTDALKRLLGVLEEPGAC